MRVAYIGNFQPPFSTENDVKKAFEHIGWEVLALQENSDFKIDLTSIDLLLITSTWDEAIPLPQWLDIIKDCADLGIPSATLHLDTFWGKSRGGRNWWKNPMFHTAYIFTADGDYQKEWKLFGKNHIWLPPAVRHNAAHFGNFRPEYECDVAFVGSNGIGYHEDVWGYRKELVDNLRSICKEHGWSFKNPGGDDPKIDRGEDMNDFYASAKVTVGDSLCLKKEKSKYWSDRVPEATGRGGCLIMPQIDELEKIYKKQIPMYKWGDFKDLENKIADQLIRTEARVAAKTVAQKNTAKNHTYVNRVKQIISEVGL